MINICISIYDIVKSYFVIVKIKFFVGNVKYVCKNLDIEFCIRYISSLKYMY